MRERRQITKIVDTSLTSTARFPLCVKQRQLALDWPETAVYVHATNQQQ